VKSGHASVHLQLRREWEEKPSNPQDDNDDARTIDVTVVGA
jgi:hypothetical protein